MAKVWTCHGLVLNTVEMRLDALSCRNIFHCDIWALSNIDKNVQFTLVPDASVLDLLEYLR